MVLVGKETDFNLLSGELKPDFIGVILSYLVFIVPPQIIFKSEYHVPVIARLIKVANICC